MEYLDCKFRWQRGLYTWTLTYVSPSLDIAVTRKLCIEEHVKFTFYKWRHTAGVKFVTVQQVSCCRDRLCELYYCVFIMTLRHCVYLQVLPLWCLIAFECCRKWLNKMCCLLLTPFADDATFANLLQKSGTRFITLPTMHWALVEFRFSKVCKY